MSDKTAEQIVHEVLKGYGMLDGTRASASEKCVEALQAHGLLVTGEITEEQIERAALWRALNARANVIASRWNLPEVSLPIAGFSEEDVEEMEAALAAAGIAPQSLSDFGESATVAEPSKAGKDAPTDREKLIDEAEMHQEKWICGNVSHTNPEVGCPECALTCQWCDDEWPCLTSRLRDALASPLIDEVKLAEVIRGADVRWNLREMNGGSADPMPHAEALAHAVAVHLKEGKLT